LDETTASFVVVIAEGVKIHASRPAMQATVVAGGCFGRRRRHGERAGV
jgi:hypothetical protein